MINLTLTPGRLKEARRIAGLQQTKVAKELGLAAQSVSAYERGVILPPINKLIALAELYGVSVDWILGTDVSRDGMKTYADAFECLEIVEGIIEGYAGCACNNLWEAIENSPLKGAFDEREHMRSDLSPLDPALREKIYKLWRDNTMNKLKNYKGERTNDSEDS